MLNRKVWTGTFAAILATGVICGSSSVAQAEEDESQNQAAVAKLLPTAKITLQKGLAAAKSNGQPISGKFEVDEGHFQLTVYTAQGGKFAEVLIDYKTGTVVKSEPITSGDDLAAAKLQASAMAKATKTLQWAVEQAVHAEAGFRAVSVMPALSNGHAAASVALLKGKDVKTVSEPLE